MRQGTITSAYPEPDEDPLIRSFKTFIATRDQLFARLDNQAHDLKERTWQYLNEMERSEEYSPNLTFSVRYDSKTGRPMLVWARISKGYYYRASKKYRKTTYVKGLRNGCYSLRIFNGLREEDRASLTKFEIEAREIRAQVAKLEALYKAAEEVLTRELELAPLPDANRNPDIHQY